MKQKHNAMTLTFPSVIDYLLSVAIYLVIKAGSCLYLTFFNDYTPKVCISWFLITKPLHVGKCLITEKEWCFLLTISFSQWSLRDLPFRNRQRNVSRFIFNLTVQLWLFWLIERGNMLCRSKCWNLICCEQTKTNEVSTFWST